MTLGRQLFQQGGSRERGRCRHCWVSRRSLDSCLPSETHPAAHFCVLQPDCASVLFFRYLIGLAGSRVWLSVLKEKDEHHARLTVISNTAHVCLSTLLNNTQTLNIQATAWMRKLFQHEQLVGSATDRDFQGKWLSPRQQRLMGNYEKLNKGRWEAVRRQPRHEERKKAKLGH